MGPLNFWNTRPSSETGIPPFGLTDRSVVMGPLNFWNTGPSSEKGIAPFFRSRRSQG